MDTGVKISGAVHGALILWIILGGTFFRADKSAELQVSEVSIMSDAEFAALVSDAPEASVAVPDQAAPEIEDDTAGLPEPETAPETSPADTPDAPQTPEASPDTEAVRERPETEAEVEPPAPPAPPEPDELAVLAPEEAAPKPADRVAPVPTPEPDPDMPRAERQTEAATPEESAESPAEPEEAVAPEAAAREIVTEAEAKPDAAPQVSARPRARPERRPTPEPEPAQVPEPQAEPAEPEAEPEPAPSEEDAIAAAIAADIGEEPAPQGGAREPATRRGPPLTSGEREGLRLAVQECWNVGALSSDALRVTVTVGVELNRDGTPRTESIRQISATGGDGAAAKQAYEAARRAIIRCGARGFDLPAEKYDTWRDVEMTFNPERMRIR
ncbi:hypothetical protein DDZ14_16900 [Maritimibacter sp. 55A14]|uniref:hypothetical protein n=1 Tax=Maritimibacter sp. 55A14 TaxID=2174844 RepID=UPI000D61E757|nr:hypothetical protein [Maritimibacter sp. 55A14]PWE29426.1 hypothetical protein DDZ14_16900 [Maritimibacter sp. 55A14]